MSGVPPYSSVPHVYTEPDTRPVSARFVYTSMAAEKDLKVNGKSSLSSVKELSCK